MLQPISADNRRNGQTAAANEVTTASSVSLVQHDPIGLVFLLLSRGPN